MAIINRIPRAFGGESLPYPFNIGWDLYCEAELDDVNYDDDDNVDPIHDFSGNARNIAHNAGTAAKFKVNIKNGLGAFSFTNADTKYLTDTGKTINQPNHIFVVVNADSDPTGQALFDGIDGTHKHRTYNYLANTYMVSAGTDTFGVGINDGWHILEYLFDGAGSTVTVDGVEVHSANYGALPLTLMCLACMFDQVTYGYQNYICLWAVHDGELAGGDLTTYRSYLSTRYDIAVA